RVFASDFLQIPLHNGHPCLSLTVPTPKPVTDFHRQVVTHAGRNIKKRDSNQIDFLIPLFLLRISQLKLITPIN
ncbi:hypothetical protein, partial [Staphylococcus coagulans]|uniref:hypothetical protein n=1 Tax=Staphylococcus coagulans TaxID=74706 RepID=UPI001C0D7903